MRSNVAICVLGLAVACSFIPQFVCAEEGGSGHYVPGSMASFADAVPPAETFVARVNLLYYEGDVSLSRPLPFAGLTTVGASVDSWAYGLTLLWRPPVAFGDKISYAMSATIPYVDINVTAEVQASGLTTRRTGGDKGLGDIVLMPVMVNYAFTPDLSANLRLGIYAPTGDYEAGRLANTGKNYWTLEPTLAVIYFGQKNGLEASAFFGADFNTENKDTDYESGTQVHVDGTLAQHLPLFGGFAGAGVSGYWYKQVDPDSGAGANLGEFKAKTTGLGPVLSYACSREAIDIVAELKWLHEVDTVNRLEGDLIWLKVLVKF